MKTFGTYMTGSRLILLRMRIFFPTHFSKNQNTHFKFSNFFFPKIVPFVRLVWKNMVEPVRPQMTRWRMRVACWMTGVADTPLEWSKFTAFPRQQ